jgi:hypothetical protein
VCYVHHQGTIKSENLTWALILLKLKIKFIHITENRIISNLNFVFETGKVKKKKVKKKCMN